MNESQTRLPAELETLFAAERKRRDRIPTAARARVLSRIAITAAAPVPASHVAHAPLVKTLATFAVGAAVGAGGHALLAPRPAPVRAPMVLSLPAVSVAPTVAAPAPVDAAGPAIHATAQAAGHAHHAPKSVAAPPPLVDRSLNPVPTTDDSLASERTLIDTARTALTRGEPELALKSVARHAREFPNGKLAEEREALRVQALLARGDPEEAATAVEAFGQRYPRSLLLPALRASVKNSAEPSP